MQSRWITLADRTNLGVHLDYRWGCYPGLSLFLVLGYDLASGIVHGCGVYNLYLLDLVLASLQQIDHYM